MNVLIACEESQTVCQAFLAKGHNAFSCDLQECSGGLPDRHIQGDCLEVLKAGNIQTQSGKLFFVDHWDLLIAHPPCTFLSNAGNHSLYLSDGMICAERYKEGLKARSFFLALLYNDFVESVVVENPIPNPLYKLPKYDLVVCPSQFGSDYKKRTCLWLRNVPYLMPTVRTLDAVPTSKADWFQYHHSDSDRQKNRSKTDPFLAYAFAEQWG